MAILHAQFIEIFSTNVKSLRDYFSADSVDRWYAAEGSDTRPTGSSGRATMMTNEQMPVNKNKKLI